MSLKRNFAKLLGVVLVFLSSEGGRVWGQACDPLWSTPEPIAGLATSSEFLSTAVPVQTAEWDLDGDGPDEPVLVVAGRVVAAGTAQVNTIALWDGRTWRGIPGESESDVYLDPPGSTAVAVCRGELYAAGLFSSRTSSSTSFHAIARWTGREWDVIGAYDFTVISLAAYHDELIAAGQFSSISDIAGTAKLAAWDGQRWHGLGDIAFGGGYPTQLHVFGDELYVGGPFRQTQSATYNIIARWDGTRWNPLGTGLSTNLNRAIFGTMATYGERLAVLGEFRIEDDRGITNSALWNGQAWEEMGTLFASSHLFPPVTAAEYHGVLYVGGDFDVTEGGVRFQNAAEWDGARWRAASRSSPFPVWTYARYQDRLIATGDDVAGVNISQYDGRTWTSMGPGLDSTILTAVSLGDRVIVGGWFTRAGSIAANHVAEYDGHSWRALGVGLDGPVRALALHEGRVVAGGSFRTSGGVDVNGVAVWNGESWEPMGGGILRDGSIDQVAALCSLGGVLYAGGSFAASRGSPGDNIAAWDGGAWRPVGTGLQSGVLSLLARQGQLIAGGYGGLLRSPWTAIAGWDGSAWRSVGNWTAGGSTVRTMVEYRGELVIGGQFTLSGTPAIPDMARLQGETWTAIGVPVGVRTNVYSLAVYDDLLLASGVFTGGTMGTNISRWDGTSWRPLGGLQGWPATCMVPLGDDLFLGGYFLGAWQSYCGYAATLNFRGPPLNAQQSGSYPTGVNTCGASQEYNISAPYSSPLAARQWLHDGRALTDGRQATGTIVRGSTTDTLTLVNLHETDAGAYACRVTSACGSAVSSAFRLNLDYCCVADVDDGSRRGIRDRGVTIDDLLYYIGLFAAGSTRADVDDGSGTASPDGAVTIDDLLYYLSRYANGC